MTKKEIDKIIKRRTRLNKKRAGGLQDDGDSYCEYPTYIKHWEDAKPWGWEIRILTEGGLHTIHLKWKDYKRPHKLRNEK